MNPFKDSFRYSIRYIFPKKNHLFISPMIPSGFVSRIPLLFPPSSCSSNLWAIWPRMSVGISPTLQEFVQRFHNKDSPRKPLKITWKSVHGGSLKFYLSFFPIIHSRNSSTDFSKEFMQVFLYRLYYALHKEFLHKFIQRLLQKFP